MILTINWIMFKWKIEMLYKQISTDDEIKNDILKTDLKHVSNNF